MSSVTPPSEFWRSTGQLENTPEYQEQLHREFPKDASVLEDEMSRRTFVKLMGATAAIAGLTGAGCSLRRPAKSIFPYAKAPEGLIPGKTSFYATTVSLGEDVIGVLAESFEGRPIKIEGNLEHPQSKGRAKAWQQASVLELYDPDRLQHVKKDDQETSLSAFRAWVADNQAAFKEKQGAGLVILTESQVSPTVHRLLAELKTQLPQVKIYRYDPINEDRSRQGILGVTGQHARVTYDFTQANIIATFGADFLGTDWGSLLYTQQFSARRDPDSKEGMSRLYVIESQLSLTGGKADHRLALTPAQAEKALNLLAQFLGVPGLPQPDSNTKAKMYPVIKALADDLTKNQGKAAILVGETLSPGTHALAAILNQKLGNAAGPVRYTELPFAGYAWATQSHEEAIKNCVADMKAGMVQTLIMIGGNPVYSAPSQLEFEKHLAKVPHKVHLTLSENDTTAHSTWAIPRTHYLESWSDAKSLDGTQSLVQPLIEPLYKSVSDIDLLTLLVDGVSSGYEAVQKTWGITSESDTNWRKWLHNGIIQAGSLKTVTPSKVSEVPALISNYYQSDKGLKLVIVPSYSLYDGRFANNGWLQELPDPITKLTWDNALLVNAKTAKDLTVDTHDIVTLKANKKSITAAIMIVPGIADNVVCLSRGYGQKKVGRVGENTGFSTEGLVADFGAPVIPDVLLTKTRKTYKFAVTQEHGSMEGRAIYRQSELNAYKKDPEFAKKMVEHPELKSSWEEKKYTEGYQWGMVIDLNKCTGCSACITACQAENNIPIVGKEQVANSREMHWIRIDRYFEGPADNPQMVQQPVTCLHCEMAPCEQVCPVAATTHSEEGLNEMTYNRCVGTRYCANNCPVKVRRFNFFDFHQRNPQAVQKDRIHLFDYFKEPDKTVQMQFNPDVTVRMRGVMEKCSYCVQRINKGKFDAKNEDRAVRDGEIQTACQQTCPANAIVFGDSLDKTTEVSKLKHSPRDYHLLAELNLKPRTSYLAGVRNPNPTLDRAKG